MDCWYEIRRSPSWHVVTIVDLLLVGPVFGLAVPGDRVQDGNRPQSSISQDTVYLALRYSLHQTDNKTPALRRIIRYATPQIACYAGHLTMLNINSAAAGLGSPWYSGPGWVQHRREQVETGIMVEWHLGNSLHTDSIKGRRFPLIHLSIQSDQQIYCLMSAELIQ